MLHFPSHFVFVFKFCSKGVEGEPLQALVWFCFVFLPVR